MKRFPIVLLIFFISRIEANQSDYKQKGKEFELTQRKTTLETIRHFSADGLYPVSQKDKKFDADEAKRSLKHNLLSSSEVLNFLKSPAVQKNANRIPIHPDELFLKKSDEIANNATKNNFQVIEDEKANGYIEQCELVGAPDLLSLIRELKVKIANQSEEKHFKLCIGHKDEKEYFWKSDADNAVKKLKKKFANDSSIKKYEVRRSGGGVLSNYKVKSEWTHHDDCQACLKYKTKVETVNNLQEIEDVWEYSDSQLFSLSQNSPDCNLIDHVCLEANSTKNIDGKDVFRPCWKEQLIFQYFLSEKNNCSFLLNHNCEQINKQCIKEGPLGCSLWKLTFKCFQKINRKLRNTGLDDFNLESSVEIEYEPNNSFAEATTKLAVFQEIQKDLKNAQEMDVSEIEIFKGKKMECSKSIASDLVYDCCFKYKGLAKKTHLAKCNSEELILADMQEQGLCHYIGSYDEKVLGIKTKDVHVFCAFPSKLAKVLHENGRRQLGLEWGTAKHPDCRGFFVDEISKLNFSTLDLSEVFQEESKSLPENFDAKLEAFHKRILDDLKKESQ